MSDLKYSVHHEWVSIEGNVATVGITDHAQEQLGDIVFVEVPEVGRTLEKDEEAAVVESVKAASEVYAPISGEVTESNSALDDAPDTVNKDPLGAGWFFKMTVADDSELQELLDENAYKALIESES
jgi:glycine cleavage system H protein